MPLLFVILIPTLIYLHLKLAFHRVQVGRQHVVWGGFAHPNLKGSRAAFHSVVFHFNKAFWGAQPTNMVPLLVCVFDMRVG